MSIELNHTIIHASDRDHTAVFLTGILGLPAAPEWGPFRIVEVANRVSLDVMQSPTPITPQHYAFLVTDEEFDAIFGRITERDLPYWADPGHRREGEINHNDGGRGVYWNDPDGHSLEIITVPYGGG